METFVVEGGRRLQGSISPSGNRNAALPILAACLLTEHDITLHNIPSVGDVQAKVALLRQRGIELVERGNHVWAVNARHVRQCSLEGDLSREVGTALLLMAPALARFGSIQIAKDSLSPSTWRRIDLHFKGLKQLGAEIEQSPDSFILRANRLKGAEIWLEESSVTATEQMILAAVLAEGDTTIINAASEPHIQDLCRFLNILGGRISGIGSDRLYIKGVSSLGGGEYCIGPDQIEVASLLCIAAITGSELRIVNAHPHDHRMNSVVFELLGLRFQIDEDDIIVPADQELRIDSDLELNIPKIDCEPWPGFATDLVSMAIVVATQASGSVLFNEKMYGNRLFFVDRLIDMGANIVLCDPYRAFVTGPTRLQGLDPIVSPDVRAGLALLGAALCAHGRSIIYNVRQIDRGFERIDERLASLGANIYRKY